MPISHKQQPQNQTTGLLIALSVLIAASAFALYVKIDLSTEATSNGLATVSSQLDSLGRRLSRADAGVKVDEMVIPSGWQATSTDDLQFAYPNGWLAFTGPSGQIAILNQDAGLAFESDAAPKILSGLDQKGRENYAMGAALADGIRIMIIPDAGSDRRGSGRVDTSLPSVKKGYVTHPPCDTEFCASAWYYFEKGSRTYAITFDSSKAYMPAYSDMDEFAKTFLQSLR